MADSADSALHPTIPSLIAFPMLCYCSQCYPSHNWTLRTIQKHLKEDLDLLSQGSHTDEFLIHLQDCIERTGDSLSSIESGEQGMFHSISLKYFFAHGLIYTS